MLEIDIGLYRIQGGYGISYYIYLYSFDVLVRFILKDFQPKNLI